jgi:hypothetical protein
MASPTTECVHSRLPYRWQGLTGFQRPGPCKIMVPGRRIYSNAAPAS